MRLRVGIYPGTFDPVHAGHIAFALAALKAGDLDEIVFLPEPKPRNKPTASNLNHRVAMLQHAVAAHKKLRVVQLDDERFTVDSTLPQLLRYFSESELTLLIGSDVAHSLPYWPNVERLLQTVTTAVGIRQGDEQNSIAMAFRELSAQYNLVLQPIYIAAERAALCSSDIRAGTIQHPDSMIARYIHQHKLYTTKNTHLGA
jgi:nicotinate-nucleotide adenylyltransferase